MISQLMIEEKNTGRPFRKKAPGASQAIGYFFLPPLTILKYSLEVSRYTAT